MKHHIQKLKKGVTKIFCRVCHKENRGKLVTSALIGALVLGLALALYAFRGVIFYLPPVEKDTPGFVVEDPKHRHPLTGLGIPERLEDLPQVFAIMIDHSADAWPQVGIDQAFLVIEAPVEGNIPRLMALYSEEQSLSKVGPVRSARPYFVDWADELDAMYVHVGGSPEALDLIATRGTFDYNQFFHAAAFWRANNRFAPHNVYTSSKRLNEGLEEERETDRAPNLLYGIWKFADQPEALPEKGIDFSVDFLGNTYRVGWEYDEGINRYQRFQSGLIYTMENGEDVHADNVIVMATDISVIDAVGRKKLRTIGEGEATVFQNGEAIDARWKKPSVSERLRFFYKSGEEIEMLPGQTWIEVVDSLDRLTREE